MKTEPTNQDLLNSFETHAKDDADFQAETITIHDAMNKRMDTLATKEDVRDIFASELKNFFRIGGMRSKTIIITVATIIGSLVVIFGGVKSFLGWLGFTFIK